MNSLQNNLENADTPANTVVVSWARENARHLLKSVIDQEAENWEDVNLQTWKIATYNIVKRLRDTSQMGFLINNIRRRLKIYSGNICFTIENRSEPIPLYSVKRNSQHSANVDNRAKAETDVLRPKYPHQLAEDISPQIHSNTRLQAFKMLLNSQLSDVVSSNNWNILQKHLHESLCDADAEIFELSLKIHSKLLTSSYNIMKEGFFSLVEGLRSHYSRRYHTFLPIVEQGLDFKNPTHYRIIKISHIILQTTFVFPEYWVRMGEKSVEEIMSSYFALISMHTYDSTNLRNMLFPFHVIATIDPKAKWCTHWLHCGFGRKICLSLQSQLNNILRYAVEEVSNYLATIRELKPKNPNDFICKETVRVSVFSHCVNMLCCFATYKKSQSFFPVTCKMKETVTLTEILCSLILYLNTNDQELNNVNLKIICNALMTLVQKKECPLVSLSKVFMVSLEPMKKIVEQKQEFQCQTIPFHSINILLALTKDEAGVMFLVKGQSNVEYEMEFCWGYLDSFDHPVNIIMNYTNCLLRCSEPCEPALMSLLHICAMLFKYYDLCSMLFPIPLIESAAIRFLILQSEIKDKIHPIRENINLKSEELWTSLIRFMSSVISHPCGLLAVVQHELVLIDMVPYLFENFFESCESSRFRRLISMLSTVQEVEETMSVECSKHSSKLFHSLWIVLEDQESFVKGIERYINTAIERYLNTVYAFSCTLLGTKIFFSEYEGSEETILESCCNPSSPSELMIFDHSCDPWHKVALLTIQALARNLDSWLYVESKFGIEKRLVQVQMQNVSSPIFDKASSEENDTKKTVIIDDCSLLRHQILTKTNVVSIPVQEYLIDFNTEELESFMTDCCSEKRKEIVKTISNNHGGKNELQQLLYDSEIIIDSTNWINSARKALHSISEDIKPSIIIALMKHVSQFNTGVDTVLNWLNEPPVYYELCLEEILGVRLSIKHGVLTGLLDCDMPNDHLLKELIQHTHTILKIEKKSSMFHGFDWFLASVFFLCRGNLEKCKDFLNNSVTLQVSVVMWPSLAESKGLNNFCLLFSSLVDIVVSASVPLAAAALCITGVPWGTVCYSWLSQCFWTVLKWNQVCEWFTLCTLYPPDVTIYYCAALLKYLEPRILQAAVNNYIWDKLVPENFIGFSISEQIPFLDDLIKEHRTVILPQLLQGLGFH